MSLWPTKSKIKNSLSLNVRVLSKASAIISFLLILPISYGQDKSFERKSVTDTKKKLDVNKGDLVDTQKKLDIRKGDLTDTKKLLRKTNSISNSQLSLLKRNVIKSVGNEAYTNATNTAPNLVKMRMKYDWFKIQVEQDYTYWKGREKREIESKKTSVASKINKNKKNSKKNNKKSEKGLSDIRKKDYEKRFKEYNTKIENYNTQISRLDKMIVDLKGGGAMSTQFTENSVGDQGARLTDKFGNFLLTLDKGQKVETKDSSLDVRYYEVKFKNKVYFGLKEYFKK